MPRPIPKPHAHAWCFWTGVCLCCGAAETQVEDGLVPALCWQRRPQEQDLTEETFEAMVRQAWYHGPLSVQVSDAGKVYTKATYPMGTVDSPEIRRALERSMRLAP